MAQKQIQERIKETIQHILDGYSHDDILEYLESEHRDKNSGEVIKKCTRSESIDIVKSAYEEIWNRYDEGKNGRIAWHMEARRSLYNQCLQISDFKAAHSILIDLGKLENLYPNQEEKETIDWSKLSSKKCKIV